MATSLSRNTHQSHRTHQEPKIGEFALAFKLCFVLPQAKNKGIPQFSLDCLILRELVKSAHAVHSIKANQAQQTLVDSSAED